MAVTHGCVQLRRPQLPQSQQRRGPADSCYGDENKGRAATHASTNRITDWWWKRARQTSSNASYFIASAATRSNILIYWTPKKLLTWVKRGIHANEYKEDLCFWCHCNKHVAQGVLGTVSVFNTERGDSWATIKKHRTAKEKVSFLLNYSQQKLLCGRHWRPTLTTARGGKHKWLCGGHRCVLVHPHFPSINSDPSGLLISCRARKWEGGQPGRRGDVTAGNEWRDCCRGWRRGGNTASE